MMMRELNEETRPLYSWEFSIISRRKRLHLHRLDNLESPLTLAHYPT